MYVCIVRWHSMSGMEYCFRFSNTVFARTLCIFSFGNRIFYNLFRLEFNSYLLFARQKESIGSVIFEMIENKQVKLNTFNIST